jgi:hypothetical protein
VLLNAGLIASSAASGGNPVDLLSGLIAWWELNDDNVWADSHTGSLDLTENGTVGTATMTGFGSRAEFDGTPANFLRRSAVDLSDSFSIAFWCDLTSLTIADTLLSEYSVSNNRRRWRVEYDGANVGLRVTNNGSSGGTRLQTSISSGVRFVGAYHDNGVELGISVDAGSFATTPYTLGTNNSDSEGFQVSGYDSGTNPFDGTIGKVALWNRVLSSVEWAELYNSGSGIAYPT